MIELWLESDRLNGLVGGLQQKRGRVMTTHEDVARTGGPVAGVVRHWPVLAGLVAAAAIIWVYRLGHFGWRQLVAVLVAAGLVYLGSAVIGSRHAAWPIFAVTVLAIAAGNRIGWFDPQLAFLVAALVLVAVALVRGFGRGTQPAEVAAMAVVLVAGFAAVALTPPWRGLVLGVGLLGHAAWDIAHYRSNRVVDRSMAEFCAVLDVVLAIAVLVITLTP